MKDEIKEIFNKYGKSHYEDDYSLEFETYIVDLKELKILFDYITTLQEENEKSKSIIKQIKAEFNKKGNPCFTFYGFWLKVRDILGDKNE